MKRNMRKWARVAAMVAAASLVLSACGGGSDSDGGSTSGGLTKVKLQLQWVPQAQFAGYYAAVDQGYYKDEGLDVQILEGGVDIVPQTVLAQGQADYAIAWVPKALASREQGAKIEAHRAVLTDEMVRRLARAALAIKRAFGGRDQDIEWVYAHGQLYIVQSRPYVAGS